jgi:MFS family permease
MKNRILGLNKNVFFLGLTSLFNDFSSEMILSIFPAFFITVLKAGAASLGMVEGFADCFSNLFKIYSGNLSDRLQKRKALVVAGYSISVMSRPFYLFVSTVGGAFGLRFIDRIGKGTREAPRDAIISLSSPADELGKSFGYHRAMDTVGAILGPLVAYLLLRRFPARFDYVFLTSFAVGILALLSLVFISEVAAVRKSKPGDLISSFLRLSVQFKLYLLSVFVLSIGNLPLAVLLLKTRSLGLVIASIPLFYMVYNISYAGLSISGGKLSDRVGARKVMTLGYFVLIISYGILILAQSTWMLLAGFLVLGLFPALTDGVQRSLAAQMTSESSRGRAFGWLNAAQGLGALLAGIGGGYLWQTFGAATAILVAVAAVLLGLTLFSLASLVHRKKELSG